MPKPTAGDLFYSVAFEKKGTASDSAGGTTTSFTEQFACRASFVHLRGGESVQAARLEGQHPQVISVRASSRTRAVTTDWRIRDKRTGDIFAIRDITPGLDRQFIDFLCQKGVAA
jgi:SPP1 family predicted phage head-tail adaptor